MDRADVEAGVGDLIPQVKRDDDGEDSWHIYGRPRPGGYSGKLGVVSGALEDRAQFAPRVWADMPVSSYVPAERVKAMDRDRVDVHAFFGNVSGVAGNTFQDPGYPADFRLACLRAYNDFQIEEYAEPYPGRFITLAALPLWDPAEAVAEVERTAKRGIKGITFVFLISSAIPTSSTLAGTRSGPRRRTPGSRSISTSGRVGAWGSTSRRCGRVRAICSAWPPFPRGASRRIRR